MKLITEYGQQEKPLKVQHLVEGEGDTKQHYIEGIFMEAEVANGNRRVYPKKILEKAVSKYVKEQVDTGRAVGELNHPESASVNLDLVSHRITDLRWEGNSVIGKALILDTPMGKIVKSLLEGGVKLAVSTRGLGSLKSMGNGISQVNEDFQLTTVDIVQNPSAPNAFINGIMEGVEFNHDGTVILENAAKKEIELVEEMTTRFADIQTHK